MAVDDQSEISFSIHQGTLPWQPFFAAVYRPPNLIFATPVASGAARWVIVGYLLYLFSTAGLILLLLKLQLINLGSTVYIVTTD